MSYRRATMHLHLLIGLMIQIQLATAQTCTDATGIVQDGQTCSQLVTSETRVTCYNTTVEAICCASCEAQAGLIPGCKYGDRTTCFVFLCSTVVDPSDCCETCFTGTTTTTTTPATTTTLAMTSMAASTTTPAITFTPATTTFTPATTTTPAISTMSTNTASIMTPAPTLSTMTSSITGNTPSISSLGCVWPFVEFSDSCYFFGSIELPYELARIGCDVFDKPGVESSLVQVDSEEELKFLKEFMHRRLLQPLFGYWNDLFEVSHGVEQWRSSGDPLIVTDWADGEPNDLLVQQSCTMFLRRDSYRQGDAECRNSVNKREVDARSAFRLCELKFHGPKAQIELV